MADKFNFWTIPSILIVSLILIFWALILGTISAVLNMGFKDYPQILNVVIQGTFFITPIVWINNPITEKYKFFELNPFFSLFIESRNILFYNKFSLHSINVLISMGVGAALAYYLYKSAKNNVKYDGQI
jgi:ABC-type polysaccharide/polyol phosphate export permease